MSWVECFNDTVLTPVPVVLFQADSSNTFSTLDVREPPAATQVAYIEALQSVSFEG